MKRLALGLMLALVALSLTTAPAMADPGERRSAPVLSAEDQELIASLALPAPTPAAKRPIVGKATCSAHCDTDPDVTCTGTTCSAVNRNCSTGTRGNVVCDGVKTSPVQSFSCDPYSCHCILSPTCL